jgi:hypothetical protein
LLENKVICTLENEPYYCKISGAQLARDAKFCSKCGTSIEVGRTDSQPSPKAAPFRIGFLMRERILRLVERFRAKGALSPETAMAASDLGLAPRFERAIEGRLGRTGIFVKVGGKYYLSEERLKEARDRLAARRGY